MNTKLTNLKTELREFIELSKTITQGKWIVSTGGDEPATIPGIETENGAGIVSDHYPYEGGGVDGMNNATFIARSRNISQAMAECLLAAIEELDEYMEGQEALNEILNIWEAAK